MKRTILYSMLLAAGLCVAASSSATTPALKCTPKVNSYTLMVDYSGSMMESPEDDEMTQDEKKEKQKAALAEGKSLPEPSDAEKQREKTKRITTAKTLLDQLNGPLSAYSIKGGLYSISPYTEIAPFEIRSVDAFNERAQTIKENMEVLGRRTPIGIGLEDHAARMEKNDVNGPVYLITDGRQLYGRPLKDALANFYKVRADSCLHIVSLADTKEGEELVNALAAGKSCSRVLSIQDIEKDPKAIEQFVKETVPMDCVENAPVLSINGINFAFDKYNIDKKSEAILQKALDYIRTRDENEKIEIIGWTDYLGSDAYNRRLSQKRAEAVKAWLVKKGIAAERMKAIGKGKSFKYDNRTEKGRYLNRRMDFRFYTE